LKFDNRSSSSWLDKVQGQRPPPVFGGKVEVTLVAQRRLQ
jgi:hypothetical protein